MKKLTTKQFINKSISIHGNEFDYSKSIYINNSTPIIIICKKHGIFLQTPAMHMSGHKCIKCKYELHRKMLSMGKEEFIKKAKMLFKNKFDYSKVEYSNGRKKVILICRIHGEFLISPEKHLIGQQCKKCARLEQSLKEIQENKKTFINKCREIHGNTYKYLSEYEHVCNKITIKCNKCDFIFKQKVANHLSGQGCPHCNQSKGELQIEKYLLTNKIPYESQKIFTYCIGKKRKLPFDFYLPTYNICIEFDGIHHYKPHIFNSSRKIINSNDIYNFNQIKKSDEIKNTFCQKEGIHLIRIPYFNKSNIKKILTEELAIINTIAI